MKTTSTLESADAMSRWAWDRRELKSSPWGTAEVAAFASEMDRAGYPFKEYEGNYPSITNEWELLFQWASSIAQNESDTLAGL